VVSTKLAPSVRTGLSLSDRALENWRLLGVYVRRRNVSGEFDAILSDLSLFQSLLERFSKKSLADARMFEVGFGARAYLLRALQSLGADAWGVDAEVPLLTGKLREFGAILTSNGWERLLKTAVRHALFDRKKEAAFAQALGRIGVSLLPPERHRFLQADAATCDPPGSFDLLYSIAVFEHMTRQAVEALVPRMATWLRPDGLAVIRVDIFTGLHGGHLREWDEETLQMTIPRRSEPWEHLRKKRFVANTTLNEMSRSEYEAIFTRHFRILEILEAPRGHAPDWLSPEIRMELSDYSDQDLLDALPTFVMRPRDDQ
jgi:SAM-dependent methyltransferase